MGKHGKQEDCRACKGTGKQLHSDNGNRIEIDCVVCNGTGKV